jgi:cell division protein ZapA
MFTDTTALARAQVNLMGKEYTLKGDVDPEYMIQLAKFVDEKIRELKSIAPSADPVKLALLVSLNTADLYFQAQQKATTAIDGVTQEGLEKLEEKTRLMLDMLEKGLVGEPVTNF